MKNFLQFLSTNQTVIIVYYIDVNQPYMVRGHILASSLLVSFANCDHVPSNKTLKAMEQDNGDLLSDYKLCGFIPVVLASSDPPSHLYPGTTCRPHSFSNSVHGFITQFGNTLLPISEENADGSSPDPKPRRKRGKRSRIQMLTGSVVDQIRTLSGNHCLRVLGTIQRVSVKDQGQVRVVVVVDVYLPVGAWSGWQFPKSCALAASFFKHVRYCAFVRVFC